MKKTLTEELILQRLKAKGIDMDKITYLEQYDKVLEIHGAEIVHEWNSNCNAFFYEESTVDGYGIYIATENDSNVNINEDVYYYEADWFERIKDYINDGFKIYVELGYEENYGMKAAIESLYEEFYIEEYEIIEDELLDEGYEYPKPE